MRYDVRHRTTFNYEQTVSVAQHVIHLMPRNDPRQQRIAFALHIDPEPSQQSTGEDYFGNGVHYIALYEPHERLIVESRSRVDVRPAEAALDLAASAPWEEIAAAMRVSGEATLEAEQFAFASPFVTWDTEVRRFAELSFTPGRPILAAAMDLTSRIFHEFEYQGGVSDVWTPVGEVLSMRKGVCQDFAHLQIAALRSLGLAARYMSGYLLTHPPAGKERMVGADASHAWIAVWAGAAGWIEFDPTNNLVPGVEHIAVGWGRDYGDVSPINGCIVGGGDHEVLVAVDVSPVV
jgi:transglutaminase-like putative cysteine protease